MWNITNCAGHSHLGAEYAKITAMNDELKKLYIEPTSRCNLSCTMCFRKTWLGEAFADMDAGVFARAVDTMPQSIETVFFGGMGEPLSHPDIIQMVAAAAERQVRVELLTNGTLLSPDMSEALLGAGLSRLWVSIDSFDTEGYEAIRQNSNFSLITRNITAYNKVRARYGREASLGIAFVAMKSNVHMLGELGRFAFKYNASDVNVSNVIPTDAASAEESLCTRIVDLGLQANAPLMPNISLPALDGRIPGVREGTLGLLQSDCNVSIAGEPLTRRRRYCRFIEEGCAFVRHDGDVSPCMALLHSGTTYLDGATRTVYHHAFGNMRDAGVSEIWDSTEYTEFRKRVRGFDFSPCILCGGCENRDENLQDCFGNEKPTCGACLWGEGVVSCP